MLRSCFGLNELLVGNTKLEAPARECGETVQSVNLDLTLIQPERRFVDVAC